MREFFLKLLTPLQTLWYTIREKVFGKKMDVSQINGQLWAGAAVTTAADVEQLASSGVTADIDCRLEFNDQSLIDGYNNLPSTPQALKAHPTIAYLYDGVADDGQPKPVSWFQTAWEFGKPILDDKGVLVCHCAAGVNRGPSMAAFFLMAYWHLTPDAARSLIVSKRPVANIAYLNDANIAAEELSP